MCLFASTPLAFLETGTLYVENLWLAFLLGTLLLALDYLRTPSNRALIALAFLAAGAMQCKVIGVIWLAPLLLCVGCVAWRAAGPSRIHGARDRAARGRRHHRRVALRQRVGAHRQSGVSRS